MGNYLLYNGDLAGVTALNLLISAKQNVLGVIDQSERGINSGLHQELVVYKDMETIPVEVLNATEEILVGVDIQPLATQIKEKLLKKFPEKKITTILEPEYINDFLALRADALQQVTFKGAEKTAPLRWGKRNVQIYIDNTVEHQRAKKVFEKRILHYFERLITAPAVIYDLGANIGLYSLSLAREYPACQIHAFEPEIHNFWKLNRNIKLNSLQNITTHLIAAGARQKIGSLYLQGELSGLGEHSLINPISNLYTPIEVWDLDSYVAVGKAPPPDVIKIDVEGYELQVLKGMTGLLKAKKPKLIIEVHQNLINEDQLYKFLRKYKYGIKELLQDKTRRFIYACRQQPQHKPGKKSGGKNRK